MREPGADVCTTRCLCHPETEAGRVGGGGQALGARAHVKDFDHHLNGKSLTYFRVV